MTGVVPHLIFVQGERAMGTEGNSVRSVQNNREERQQGISEERIRLVVPRLSIGHESSKTAEFSTEWMVNQEKQAARN